MVFFISVVKIYGDTADGVIIFFLLFLYGLSIITLSFVFTSFFNQATDAILFGFRAIIILSVPNYIHFNMDTSVGVKWLTSLLSPVALGLGLVEVCALRALINFCRPLGCTKMQSFCFFCFGCLPVYFILIFV